MIANTKQRIFIPFSIPGPLQHVNYLQFRINKPDTWITSSCASLNTKRGLHPDPNHQTRHVTYMTFRITKYNTWITPNSESPNTKYELHRGPDHQIRQFNYIHIRITKKDMWLPSSYDHQNTYLTCINYKSPLYRILSYTFRSLILSLA
jgi:hypothetical protein